MDGGWAAEMKYDGCRVVTTALRRQVPVTYLPFDVLAADGGELMAAPYLERRAASTASTAAGGSRAVG